MGAGQSAALAVSQERYNSALRSDLVKPIGTPYPLSLVSEDRLRLLQDSTGADGKPLVSLSDLEDIVDVVVPAGGQSTVTLLTPQGGWWRFLWIKCQVKAATAGQWTNYDKGIMDALPAYFRLRRRDRVRQLLDDIRVSIFLPSSMGRCIADDVPLHSLCDGDQLGIVRQNYLFTSESQIRLVFRNTSSAERRVSGVLFGYALVL